jgi:hypothetical protein
MSLATIAVIVFMAITLALFAVIEVNSRRRGRHSPAGEEDQERDAA